MEKKRSKIWDILYALYCIGGILLILLAVSCVSKQHQDEYDRTHAYCEKCYEEMHLDSLIEFADGNGYMCSECLHKYHDDYGLCDGCGYVILAEDAYLNTYCDECASAKIVDYTSQGTPIVSIKNDIPWEEPHESECFSEIAYDAQNEILYVRFRESGAAYRYLNFSEDDWEIFKTQDSLGSWYNKVIKGQYDCEKIEE